MDRYLQDAWDFIREAKDEFARGKAQNDVILMRDACEKAWGAMVQAVNGLFVRRGVSPLPKSHRDRRIRIRELESEDEALKARNLFDRFMARDNVLHQRAFYDGDLIPPEVEVELEKVEGFIRDVEEVA